MAGTSVGGKKAAQKNMANNPNFYRDIGAIGGGHEVPLADSPHTYPVLVNKSGASITGRSAQARKAAVSAAESRVTWG